MQCGEMMYHKVSTVLKGSEGVESRIKRPEREAIHSGHFMVSHFEAEEQDDEDEVAVPVPEEEPRTFSAPNIQLSLHQPVVSLRGVDNKKELTAQHLSIETSLSKLFQCMSLAYRQKLTSPKWNRFKGIRLRWKEKIRLNNVIWRCWHMQFILKQSTLVCQFASPLDVDTHNKPEAVVLEGKYWKRKLAAVTAEYKKWRMYRRNQVLGCARDGADVLTDVDMLDWQPDSNDSNSMMMMVDQDYMEFMTDTLFSTIQSNQPFAFPDTREIAKGAGLADFIQPSLVQLQPNLDDFMDTLEPLQELLYGRLPPVPEEGVSDDTLLRSLPGASTSDSYPDLSTKSGSSGSLDSHSGSLPMLAQIDQAQQNMGIYSQMTDSYRQPEFVSVGAVGSESIGSRAIQPQFSGSDLQVPIQLTHQSHQESQSQQQPLPQPSQQPSQQRSPSKTRISRSNRSVSQISQQPVHRKQILPMQQQQLRQQEQQQRLQQQHYQQQQTQQQQTQQHSSSNYQLFAPLVVQPQPPPPPPSLPQSPPRTSIPQVKIIPHGFASQSSPQLQSPVQSQQQAQQTVLTSEPFKFSAPVTQRSYSLPSPSAPAPGVYTTASNFAVGTSGMSNIHTGSLSSLDKTVGRSETELFAVPKYQKLRNRSRSGSSLLPGSSGSGAGTSGMGMVGTSAGMRGLRPLVSAASNPDLSSVQTSALLAQLLTTNSTPVYNFTGSSDTNANGRVSIGTSKAHTVPILPMPSVGATSQVQQTTALLITTPVSMAIQSSTSQGQQVLMNSGGSNRGGNSGGAGKSSDTASDSSAVASPVGLSLSPLNIENMSPPQTFSSKSENDHRGMKIAGRGEHRRVCHINAEQKRRCNIKNGFDMLHSLIPQLSQNPNTKTSKAAMLQKGAEYIKQLRVERNQLKEEMDNLRQQIEGLNSAISNCQSMLPATGAPVSRHRASKMREMFDEYVRIRTLENWKFWIFSLMVEPLLATFNSSVSTTSMDELYRTTMQWVEQHCSLVELRPVVLNSLRYLCTSTDILSDPSKLPEEAQQAVNRIDGSSNTSTSTNNNSCSSSTSSSSSSCSSTNSSSNSNVPPPHQPH